MKAGITNHRPVKRDWVAAAKILVIEFGQRVCLMLKPTANAEISLDVRVTEAEKCAS